MFSGFTVCLVPKQDIKLQGFSLSVKLTVSSILHIRVSFSSVCLTGGKSAIIFMPKHPSPSRLLQALSLTVTNAYFNVS